MNKISDNLSAELLIQAASYKVDQDPSPSSVQKGTAAFNHLSNILNFENPSFTLIGGAGISRHNAVKPVHVIKLLETLHDSEFRTLFRKSLPIAGVDGTLAERFKGTFAEANLIAKTGTLSGVSTLAGYATTKRGKNICFCLFVNHHSSESSECRRDIDKLVVSLLEQL
jgi:PBP4 family serine-type D-alanyl-D-alanine carboxypeptidase